MRIENLPVVKKVCNIFRFGVIKWLRGVLKEPRLRFANELSIVTIAKNEGRYFKEWLEYHIHVGVEKFYIYDNESNDDTVRILQPYIDRGIVEYEYYPGNFFQGELQKAAIPGTVRRCKYATKWLLHIDLDEFIVPVETETVPEFLRKLPAAARELVITSVTYGSDGHKTCPEGLVIENYMRRTEKFYGCKSVMNPRFFYKYNSAHVFNVAGDMIDENGTKYGYVDHPRSPPPANRIRINHYHCKSFEEYREKCEKRDVAHIGEEDFKKNDRNEVYDPIMEKYIPIIRPLVAGDSQAAHG